MRFRPHGGLWLSLVTHALLLGAILGTWRASRIVLVQRLPGTAQGTQRLLMYSMGGAPPHAQPVLPSKSRPVDAAVPRFHVKAQPTPLPTVADAFAPGAGASGASALGDGNISIALVKFHPRPAPDLSSLPQGTTGDVVLDATIDAQGHIASLKLAKGFGGQIDQTVIATVQQWTFAPATKDGVPVASEQEILFHYERS